MTVYFQYDREVDAGFLKFSDGESAETLSPTAFINLDFDSEGRLVGIEILDVSKTAPSLLEDDLRRAVAAE